MANINGEDVLGKIDDRKLTKVDTLANFIVDKKTDILRSLEESMSIKDFTRITLSALRQNMKLASADKVTIITALLQAVELKLEPNSPLGEAWIIPYMVKGTLVAQFQIGYRGILSLAWRSMMNKKIYAHAVDENDYFNYSLGTNKNLEHRPASILGEKPSGKIKYYYGGWELVNGGFDFSVMDMEEMEAHRKRFADKDSFAWKQDYNSMALKTVLKKSLNYAPKSKEFAKAYMSDETVKKEISKNILDVPADYYANQIEKQTDDNGKPKAKAKKKEKTEDTATPEDNRPATDKQLKRMWAMANEAMIDTEEFKVKVKARYKLEHINEIDRTQIDKVFTELEESIEEKKKENEDIEKAFDEQEELK